MVCEHWKRQPAERLAHAVRSQHLPGFARSDVDRVEGRLFKGLAGAERNAVSSDWAVWHLPGGLVGPPARWAASTPRQVLK